MNLGATIKELRKLKGETQNEFAQACGITQTYLSQIENNQKLPTLNVLQVFSRELNIPLPFLFFRTLTEDDIDPRKREAYKILGPTLRSLVDDLV